MLWKRAWTVVQTTEQGLSDFTYLRQAIMDSAFASNTNLSQSPVNIFQS